MFLGKEWSCYRFLSREGMGRSSVFERVPCHWCGGGLNGAKAARKECRFEFSWWLRG